MTVAFDASSRPDPIGSLGNHSWTHSPNAAPQGVLVITTSARSFVAVPKDEIVSVTYGARSLVQVSGSPLLHDAGFDSGTVNYFWAGSNIPAGDQLVTVTTNEPEIQFFAKYSVVITLTGAEDLDIVDIQILSNTNIVSPAAVLGLAGRDSFAALGLISGHGSTEDITELTNWSVEYEQSHSNRSGAVYRYDLIGSTDILAGWVQAASGAGMIAAAFSEQTVTAGPPHLTLTRPTIERDFKSEVPTRNLTRKIVNRSF